MSRIGRLPVPIPEKIRVTVTDDNTVKVEGPKGKLEQKMHADIKIRVEDANVIVERSSDTKRQKALHGLTRSLINNMVTGVSQGFEKSLEINGVGYRAQKKGNTLVLYLGYSHPIEMKEPDGITIEVPAQTKILVKGIDKQAVGQIAAQIREKRPPEPYKGKGIKYQNEYIRRKEGKTGAV